jgi:single-stranded-DNA-specific exonuclease
MDLVALGTVADVMPLIGLNRILVRAGLEVMNQPDCLWVEALRKQQNNFGEAAYTSEDISYRFAPRINAPGRLGMPGLAFELLSSNSAEESEELAIQIEEMNKQRREHEVGTLEQVIAACKTQEDEGASAFVVEGDFHQGVIGIIASRIVDLYQKPVIIFTEDTSRLGAFKGSGRSVEGINLYDALEACSTAIIQFGGHAMAAGLAIHKDNLQFFTKQFQAAVAELVPQKTASHSLIPIDYPAKPEEVLHRSFLEKYHHLQPFGNDNLEPVFIFEKPNFVDTSVVKNNHLTFSLKVNGQVFKGIGFGMADKLKFIRQGPVQLAYKIKNTVYRGEKRVEIHAVDIHPAS